MVIIQTFQKISHFIEDDSEGDDYEDFTDESIDEPGQYGSDDTEAAG